MPDKPVRHILSLSGGKDSTALALHMRDRVPDMEYVFCDTGEELPETYEYLKKLEAHLGRPIKYLKNNRQAFKDLLAARNNFLPSPQARWCTQYLKIVPFEEYVGDDDVLSYIAIRADEAHRKGYISSKPNIRAVYPFIEDGIVKADVFKMLEESGLGAPKYYEWRSRSGCYFCFFQQRIEWVGLLERHPDLFEKAEAMEKLNAETGEGYTWSGRESLAELRRPERVGAIKAEAEARRKGRAAPESPFLIDALAGLPADEEDDELGCLICHL